MAFKNTPPPSSAPDSPEKLILDLPRRKIKGALHHQGEVMRTYGETALHERDVAFQLPTGSGKTLVGLMIAEWRRRKFGERVVYLCPTKQLVNQVVEQAEGSYGLTVRGFTGKVSKYDATAKTEYKHADRVAITTYSSLFNSNPFFSDADIIVVDDAHAAENYIASKWSISVSKFENLALYVLIANLLKDTIGLGSYTRMTSNLPGSFDTSWVDKVPSPALALLHEEFQALLDAHSDSEDVKYVWPLLRDRLSSCHLYISPHEILLRPLIPPTWDFAPFSDAKQRIFMSATFGSGGDLERLTGREKIRRISVPDGWDKQGIGRRFFIFPDMSLNEDTAAKLRRDLMKASGRNLVLVPSDAAAEAITDDIEENLGYTVLGAADIETSKQTFVSSPRAVAVVANRYDGIDFPGDDCRLLLIDGLPKAMNIQEKFLMSRMGANALYNERVQTRVLQAIGRCTRSLEDYSAVVVCGEDLPNYLADRVRRRHLHPELQAELDFGIEQSKDTTSADILENFSIFLRNDTDWENANSQILIKRDGAVQEPFPAILQLADVVGDEIGYQRAMWHGDYLEAINASDKALGKLLDPELKGYRALWHYLKGSACLFASTTAGDTLALKAKEHFRAAKNAAPSLPWLVGIAHSQEAPTDQERDSSLVFKQLEAVEIKLEKLGTMHSRKFDLHEKSIIEGLNNTSTFEAAHVLLGEILGFSADKRESDASPDPWWFVGSLCFVFEDHAGALSTSKLDATKARQAASHPNWIRANVPEVGQSEVLPILISPVSAAEAGAIPHLVGVGFWKLDDFTAWAQNCMRIIRELRRTFREPGDLVWRAEAAEQFIANKMDAKSIRDICFTRSAADILGTP